MSLCKVTVKKFFRETSFSDLKYMQLDNMIIIELPTENMCVDLNTCKRNITECGNLLYQFKNTTIEITQIKSDIKVSPVLTRSGSIDCDFNNTQQNDIQLEKK
ncbi:Hypothetical_protein [Hexamita inflata]|uniref:Hypothetical_protein n=1 Tax=Hexamita inflata TaxID=28002 RepID=A0AA86NU53_9EUKA|nr:Hypothetical protein HINF_LOCUS12665 [Hexamita inflata]